MVCLWWIGVVKDRWPRASLFSFSKTCRQTFPAHPPTYAQTTSYICGKTPTSELQIFKVLKPESLRNLLADLFSIKSSHQTSSKSVSRAWLQTRLLCNTNSIRPHLLSLDVTEHHKHSAKYLLVCSRNSGLGPHEGSKRDRFLKWGITDEKPIHIHRR